MSRKLLQMQRKVALARIKINYQMDCQWRIEIDGQPSDMDLFSREVSYGKGSIDSDTISLRTGDLNSPAKKTAGSVTVVFNDDEDGKISSYIESLQSKIFNSDGTQNLPVDYLINLKIYRLKDNGTERLDKSWLVYVESNDDYSGNNDSRTELGTFSATFKKYKSIGN